MIGVRIGTGPREGEELVFERQKIEVGRHSAADLSFADSQVSGRHCSIERRGADFVVRDLESRNGTRVDDPLSAPITAAAVIGEGSVIVVGSTELELFFPEAEEVKTEDAPTVFVGRVDAGADRPRSLPAEPSTAQREPVENPPRAGRGLNTPSRSRRRQIQQRVQSVRSDVYVVDDLAAEGDPQDILLQQEGRARLRFLTGRDRGRYVFLGKSPVLFGRAENADAVLNDTLVGEHQFEIQRQGEGYVLCTLDPEVETKINGQVISSEAFGARRLEHSQAPLGHGDVVTVGTTSIEFYAGDIDVRFADPLSTVALPQPRFAFKDQLLLQPDLLIGRAADADLQLDDRRVERQHAQIEARFPGYCIRDLSLDGLKLNGQRTTDAELGNGDEIEIGGFRLRIELGALVCAIEVLPPKPEFERFALDVEVASPHLTMYRLPVDVSEEETAEPEAGPDRTKVRWREPSDVRRSWRAPLIVLAGSIASLLVVGVALASLGGYALVEKPISGPHRSSQFSAELLKLGHQDACSGCHGPTGQAASNQACESCHPGDEHLVRTRSSGRQGDGHASIAGDCLACHTEHQVTSRALISGEKCAECHDRRHLRLVANSPPPFFIQDAGIPKDRERLVNLRADYGPGWIIENASSPKHLAFQEAHGGVRKCNGCHAINVGTAEVPKAQDRSKHPETPSAWTACLYCHAVGDPWPQSGATPATVVSAPDHVAAVFASQDCANCHREHDETWAEALPATPPPPSSAGLSWLGGTFLLFALGLVFAGHSVLRRRSPNEAEEEASSKDEELKSSESSLPVTKCEGQGSGYARRLPRLSPNRCTGSAICVDVCPYGVLRMQDNKPVVVRPELCHECQTCVEKCGPGALRMAEPDEPDPKVKFPDLDANYQTGIAGREDGVYIIGEAAGKPLVKNANNLGRWVVEHILHEGVRPGSARDLGADVEIAIVGAGPGGLAAAITARRHELSHLLLEASEDVGGSLNLFPAGKKVMDGPADTKNVGPLWVDEGSKETMLERWTELLEAEPPTLAPNMRVQSIRAEGEGFVVETLSGGATRDIRCLRVILALGTRGDPRKLDKPGDNLPKVLYRLRDPKEFSDQDIAVVGGGDSALEAAIALSSSNRVTVLYRGESFHRAKAANRTEVTQLGEAGRLTVLLETSIVEVKPTALQIKTRDGEPYEISNEIVFCMLGSEKPIDWFKKLGIKIVDRPFDWDPGPTDQPAFQQHDELRRF